MSAKRRFLRAALPALVAGGLLVGGRLGAGAVSGGGYDPGRQGCSPTADRNDSERAQPGCHNATLQVGDGSGGWHLATVGTDQTANGAAVHSGSVTVDPGAGRRLVVVWDGGTGGAATWANALSAWAQHPSGPPPLLVIHPGLSVGQAISKGRPDLAALGRQGIYFGADDNLDVGEHDSVNPNGHGGSDRPVAKGPSDGGALQVNTHPAGSLDRPASLAGNVAPGDSHNPVRAADAAAGGCADGVCAGADTMRRTLYRGGCTSCPDQRAYADQGTTAWRSPNCNSGDTGAQDHCGKGWQSGSDSGSIRQPYDERGGYVSDPGVFVYEDPDPQASPLLPTYPLCELYVGTQGVWVCSTDAVPPVAAPPSRKTAAAPLAATAAASSRSAAVPAPAAPAPSAPQASPAVPAPAGAVPHVAAPTQSLAGAVTIVANAAVASLGLPHR
jgi:hypothetical protein